MSAEDQKCVFLWAVPRSLSTVMTKCMSFVDGVQVWHEPYQYTLHKEKFAAIPTSTVTDETDQLIMEVVQKSVKKSTEEIEETPKGKLIDDKLFGYPWLKEQLETQDKDKKLIFVKDISPAVHDKYHFLPTERKYRHTFLIRDPHRVYTSVHKMLSDSVPEEYKKVFDMRKVRFYDAHLIFQHTHNLWKYVKENLDSEPIIIDATELADHPEELLPKYFEALGIPWKEEYLIFDARTDVTTEWKANYQWFVKAIRAGTHKTALGSTRFIPEANGLPSRESMTEDVLECIDGAMPFYNEMYEQRLKP